MVLGGLPEQIVRQGLGSSPTVLNSEFHGVWAHSTLTVFLSGGMVHLPYSSGLGGTFLTHSLNPTPFRMGY